MVDQTAQLQPERYFSDGYESDGYESDGYESDGYESDGYEAYKLRGVQITRRTNLCYTRVVSIKSYLARLGRKSRCFSRRLEALARQVKLFRSSCSGQVVRVLLQCPADICAAISETKSSLD